MNKIKYKLYISLSLASIASVGNIPYGYRFAYSLFHFNTISLIVCGYIFAISAMIANIALGGYSLVSIKKNDFFEQKIYVTLLGIAGAMPVGFICFLGYLSSLPIYINIILSAIVAFVNAGIDMRAIMNLLAAFNKINKELKKDLSEILLRIIGFIIGIGVSSVGFVAATSSLSMLFVHYKLSETMVTNLSYTIAILTWIPSAALFAHATQHIFGDIYQSLKRNKINKMNKKDKLILIFFIILSILSGSSITQMVIELFKPENSIPEFLKQDYMQWIIYKCLTPLAFISSSAVNFFALKNLLKYFE